MAGVGSAPDATPFLNKPLGKEVTATCEHNLSLTIPQLQRPEALRY